MKQAVEMEWTAGTGKTLSKLGAALHKSELEQEPDADIESNPALLVQDLNTGSSIVMMTEPHEGGKTHGNGYRRCRDVRQRVPAALPTKKVIGRLARMAVRNFVPADTDPEQYSIIVQRAIEDIAAELADESVWSAEDDKFGQAIVAAVNDVLDLTWRVRKGDTLLKMEAYPLDVAVMDTEQVKEMIEMEVIE
tara:strand:- start:2216 stop:2794 length:579 start_codon:yes stop_codon:yes gene_type:complete